MDTEQKIVYPILPVQNPRAVNVIQKEISNGANYRYLVPVKNLDPNSNQELGAFLTDTQLTDMFHQATEKNLMEFKEDMLRKDQIALQEAIKQINEKKEKDIKNIHSTASKNRENKKKEFEAEAEKEIMKRTIECQGKQIGALNKAYNDLKHSYNDLKHSYNDLKHSYNDLKHSQHNIQQQLSVLYSDRLSIELGNLFVEYWEKHNLLTQALAALHIEFDNIGDIMTAANPTSKMYNPDVRNWLETICTAHGWDLTQLLQVDEYRKIRNQLVHTKCNVKLLAQAIGTISNDNSRNILAEMFKELFHLDWNEVWEK